jgi:hypothetical protein
MKIIQEVPEHVDLDTDEDNGLPNYGCLATTGACIAFWIIVLIIVL